MYIAREGGYYQKYGLDVDLEFGVHPAGIAMLTSGQAVMVNHSLEQGMVASSKDASSFALVGSSSNKGLFALMAQKEFTSPQQLKGKRIAVGQIGDAPYNYTVALLGTYGLGVRDVQWIPVGLTSAGGPRPANQSRRRHAPHRAVLPTGRSRLQGVGKSCRPRRLRGHRLPVQQESHRRLAQLAESIIKAHAETIKRFYDDKAFAVKSYMLRQAARPTSLRITICKNGSIFDRVPYVAPRSSRRRAAGRSADRRGSQGLRLSQVSTTGSRVVKEATSISCSAPRSGREQRKSEIALKHRLCVLCALGRFRASADDR